MKKNPVSFKDIAEFDKFLSDSGLQEIPANELRDYYPITKAYKHCHAGCKLIIALLEKTGQISFTLASDTSDDPMQSTIGLMYPVEILAYRNERDITIERYYGKTNTAEIRIPLEENFEGEFDNG